MRSPDSLATILLCARLASEGLQPLKAVEFWQLGELVGPPGSLLAGPPGDLPSEGRLPAELAGRVTALLARATAVAFELEALERSGLSVLTPFDECYPRRLVEQLGPRAPAVLYAAGALALLGHPGVGVWHDPGALAPDGLRDAASEGAVAVAEVAARLGVPVVLGGTKGWHHEAMEAAAAAGGTTVAVLADPMVRTLRRAEVRRAVLQGTSVLCSPYGPDVPYSSANAAGAHTVAHAQSVLSVVLSCRAGVGEVWTAAIEAIERRPGSVAVWQGSGSGDGPAALAGRGALVVSDPADLAELLGRRVAAP